MWGMQNNKEALQKYLWSNSEASSFGIHIWLSAFYFPANGKEEILIKMCWIASSVLIMGRNDTAPHPQNFPFPVNTAIELINIEWKRKLVAHGDAREEKWRGKRRMEWVAKQSSVWLGTVQAVLLQSFSADPNSKKASTRLNWHPRQYKWTRPFRWKTESGFCACAITFRFHSTNYVQQ